MCGMENRKQSLVGDFGIHSVLVYWTRKYDVSTNSSRRLISGVQETKIKRTQIHPINKYRDMAGKMA